MNLRQLVLFRLAKPDYAKVRRDYKSAIYGLIWLFLTGSETAEKTRKKMEGVVLAAFLLAYELGFDDGKDMDKKWVKERITKEFVFISALIAELWALKQTGMFDARTIADARATGYTASLDGVYNVGKVAGAGDELLTFLGQDGKPPFPCPTCDYWWGKTRPASFWIENNLVPYPGNETLSCKGWRCLHYLERQDGTRFTI